MDPAQADRASAILKEDPPDLLATRRNIPPALDRIVRPCLEKSPEERFQSACDLAFHLESASSVSDSGTAAPTLFQKEKAVRPPRWMIAFLGLALASGAAWWFRERPQPGPKVVKFLRLTDYAELEESPAFSPDGKSVAFVGDSTETRQIWIRLLAGGAPLQITRGSGWASRARVVAGLGRHYLLHSPLQKESRKVPALAAPT
jgi:hypothetical protein